VGSLTGTKPCFHDTAAAATRSRSVDTHTDLDKNRLADFSTLRAGWRQK
jgi:hypothetical protein